MLFKGVTQDKNIVNLDQCVLAEFAMEQVLHCLHTGSRSIHVFLHHDRAGQAAEGCLDSIVLYIIWMHSGLEVAVAEIYLAAESSDR